jgi:integrase
MKPAGATPSIVSGGAIPSPPMSTPHWGNCRFQQLIPGLSCKLDPIWTEKPETASRVRGRIEAVLDAATVRGFREGPNPAQWKGNLAHILPARARVRKVAHYAALPFDRMPDFLAALRKRPGTAARALEFAIFAAARTGQVLGARWSEIDLTAKVWTVPADRMKAGREHRVPLSDAALPCWKR